MRSSPLLVVSVVHSTGWPCALSWTRQRNGSSGVAHPVHTGRSAVISLIARLSAGPTVTVLVTGSMSSTYRGLPSVDGLPIRRPLRCPIVNPKVPSWSPTTAPLSSTIEPGASPSFLARKPRVSPSATKHTSWLSGLSATISPRRAASARTWFFCVSPSGNIAWLSCARVSTASTYDWSLPGSAARRRVSSSSRA